MSPRLWLVALACVIATPAFAQDYSSIQSRLDRIERDLTFLQRQAYQDPNGNAGATGVANSGALQTQVMQLQEEIRRLQGQIEQSDYKSQQNADALKKFQGDVDYRLQALEQAQSAPAPTAAVPPPAPAASVPAGAPIKRSSTGFDVNEGASAADPAASANQASYQPAATPAPVPTEPSAKAGFANAREHYNYAFKLLNDAKYADAAASFEQFTQAYPKDTLTPNAYYWMGESYYARRDFKSAAEGFRKGYEVDPKGGKAADNLLKLSLSLANLKRQDEACIVLKQVSVQYSSSNKATAAKADSEYKRLGCA